jgi:hypothetical protein
MSGLGNVLQDEAVTEDVWSGRMPGQLGWLFFHAKLKGGLAGCNVPLFYFYRISFLLILSTKFKY